MLDRARVWWSDLGLTPYLRALELQAALADRLGRDRGDSGVLFLEHPPTITLGYSLRGDEGRSALKSDLAQLRAAGIEVVEVDRGGKATYHGPGQLICYPVLSLKDLHLGVKRYVGALMDVVLEALRDLGVAADLDPSYPGVWSRGAKLAAVGVRVQDRITTHGFAVNINPDLTQFRHIVPCGIADRPVTSLLELGGPVPSRTELIAALLGQMEKKLRVEMTPAGPEEIWSRLLDKEAC